MPSPITQNCSKRSRPGVARRASAGPVAVGRSVGGRQNLNLGTLLATACRTGSSPCAFLAAGFLRLRGRCWPRSSEAEDCARTAEQ